MVINCRPIQSAIRLGVKPVSSLQGSVRMSYSFFLARGNLPRVRRGKQREVFALIGIEIRTERVYIISNCLIDPHDTPIYVIKKKFGIGISFIHLYKEGAGSEEGS